MPDVDLLPLPRRDESLLPYLDSNFERLREVLTTEVGTLSLVARGQLSVLNVGGSVLAGTVAPAGTHYLLQANSQVVTTDVNGFATVTFPTKFPSGLVTVTVSNGGNTPLAGMFYTDTYTLTTFRVRVLNHDGAAYASSGVRLNWQALGW